MKELQVIEQREIEFYQDSILSVLTIENGEKTIYVPTKRLSDNFGLDSSSQLRRIKRSAILSEGKGEVKITTPGGMQYMSCLRYDLIPFWAATIEDSLVRPELRQKVIWYQKEVARVLAKEFLGINGHERETRGSEQKDPEFLTKTEILGLAEKADDGGLYSAAVLGYYGIVSKNRVKTKRLPKDYSDNFFGNSHKIINTKKAAEIIGCNVSTVQRKCVAGRIRAFRDNTSGRWLIPFESIQRCESKKVRK
ncbi:MAG: phage antirepressor N-terminal domain-containing protein [Thermodesulfobacteriota bacterium]|nr:phage antirepressor N-terminal domain-containing protein [Thermodesulfobacteriota bacterium]